MMQCFRDSRLKLVCDSKRYNLIALKRDIITQFEDKIKYSYKNES